MHHPCPWGCPVSQSSLCCPSSPCLTGLQVSIFPSLCQVIFVWLWLTQRDYGKEFNACTSLNIQTQASASTMATAIGQQGQARRALHQTTVIWSRKMHDNRPCCYWSFHYNSPADHRMDSWCQPSFSQPKPLVRWELLPVLEKQFRIWFLKKKERKKRCLNSVSPGQQNMLGHWFLTCGWRGMILNSK